MFLRAHVHKQEDNEEFDRLADECDPEREERRYLMYKRLAA